MQNPPHTHLYEPPQATSPGPVCPQRFPEIGDEADALYRMPLARLRALQYLRPRLLRQSEDCLYLNLFVPRLPQSQSQTQRQQRGGGQQQGGGGRGEWNQILSTFWQKVHVAAFNT